MKELITTITKRGQVTIPAEVRRILGVRPTDKVAFEINGNQVRISAARFTLESAFGSVEPLRRPEDFKALSRSAVEEHVQKTVEEMHDR